MDGILHITSGDSAGGSIENAGIPGEVLVWRDVLYDGLRDPAWPDEDSLLLRAQFLWRLTAGGLDKEQILAALKNQYQKLAAAAQDRQIVLWFDACLFDLSMLSHILACLGGKGARRVDLLCIDSFPGIVPFDGLGQLLPEQLASVYQQRRPVTPEQFDFARMVDRAFALQDKAALTELSKRDSAPLPWIPAGARRWLQEQPDPRTGLGRLEQLALEAIHAGCETPDEIYSFVVRTDTHPIFWGDTTLWSKINALADREPALVRINGPAARLPQWGGPADWRQFRIMPSAGDGPAAKN